MTSHALAWLVRWHRWQAARGHDVTHSRMVGALASLVRWHRWQAARGHDVTLSHGWSVGIVGRLPEVMTSQLSHGWSMNVGRSFQMYDKQVQNAAHAHRWSLVCPRSTATASTAYCLVSGGGV